MIKKYEQDGEFHKEIEVKWDEHDFRYEIIKRTVSGDNSAGHAMQFTIVEFRYLFEIMKSAISGEL